MGNHSIKPYGNIIALLNSDYFDAALAENNDFDWNFDYIDIVLMYCGA